MPSPRYPLQPLAQLRGEKVDDAARELARAARQREAAENARLAAERSRDDHGLAAALVRDSEREALARGELQVADLALAGAWSERVAAESEALASGVDRARAAEARASEAERGAQATVTARRAEAEVVARHRARWDEKRREADEAREEEAASEAWRPAR